ncbi:MAG: GntP family permease [Planctomycetaceae bacterium]|nr:GntP family permease [Planctomycetaceae bacterium]
MTIVALAAGLVIVVGGILFFRLHAFVALILAGALVAILTPSRLVVRSAQLEKVNRRDTFTVDGSTLVSSAKLSVKTAYILVRDPGEGALVQIGSVVVPEKQTDRTAEEPGGQFRYPFALLPDESLADGSVAAVIEENAFLAAAALGKQNFMSRLTGALGGYCGSLAILIVSASIIGRCLMDSGAADTIVRRAVGTVGEKNAPVAFAFSGFTLSIPVFFDTVFYLMIPLGQALRKRTGRNYLLYVLSIVAGGTMAHSLVPPTPGPLAIAVAFNVSVFSMIVAGTIVGLFSSAAGMLYAVWINGRCELQLPEYDEGEPRPVLPEGGLTSDKRTGPSLLVSLVPILLPVLLIAMGALVQSTTDAAGKSWHLFSISISPATAEVLKTLGEKNLALLLSAIVAVLIYVKARRPDRETFSAAMQHAVSSAGTIILVTAAGGAFGRMMRQANAAELLDGLQGSSPVMIVVAAFFVTTAVRTAQGSSTVAMMTAAGIFAGLVTSGAAGVDPLYVALAVGCGSKPVAWMNDSGFWVITRMSGMTEREGLTYVTPMTALAALAGLAVIILGVLFLPNISELLPAGG